MYELHFFVFTLLCYHFIDYNIELQNVKYEQKR